MRYRSAIQISSSSCYLVLFCSAVIDSIADSSIVPHSHFLACLLSLVIGIPGLTNPTALGALFSLTATGLYSSYLIPILLRVTVSRNTFEPAEFNLGKYSKPFGVITVLWATFMIVVLCLPQDAPITINNMNYSPIALGIVILGAFSSWVLSARFWFKGMFLPPDQIDFS